MSKQFITVSAIEDGKLPPLSEVPTNEAIFQEDSGHLIRKLGKPAHPSSILALAVAPAYIITGSGSASLKVHSIAEPGYPLLHEFRNAHNLGCHHLSASMDGAVAVSAGFEGEIKIWDLQSLSLKGSIPDHDDGSCVWAIAASGDGKRCATTTQDGRVRIWDLVANPPKKIIEYETKKSFGSCVDMSDDGKLTASGHENGGIHIFNNESERLLHSLIGLAKAVRDVSFAPNSRLLAACGDFLNISVYDVQSGEQLMALNGHSSWVFSVGWNTTGTLLLSSSLDGKAKVWSLEKKECIATVSESSTSLFKARYLPQRANSEEFVTVGNNISFHREAAK